MKRLFCLLCAAFILGMLLSFPVSAHSGKTDSNGGHYDHDEGEYHYHHGYPAHDHYDVDGDGDIDCPYDFDDQTNRSNTGGNGSGNSDSYSGDYSAGYHAGNQHGYEEGYEEGFALGENSGYEKGYKKGYDEGVRDANFEARDVLSEELKENTKVTIVGTLAFTFFFLIPLGAIILESLPSKEKTHRKSEIERLKEENIKLRNGSVVQQLLPSTDIDIPNGIQLNPACVPVKGIVLNYRPFGDYTVYTSARGTKYHCRYRCSNATNPMHFFSVPSGLEPCKNCVSKDMYPQPVPDWYLSLMGQSPKLKPAPQLVTDANVEANQLRLELSRQKEIIDVLNMIAEEAGMSTAECIDQLYISYLMKMGYTEEEAKSRLHSGKQKHADR